MTQETGSPASSLDLDFSVYHPLDHTPFTATCRNYYGGWRNHLQLEWSYRLVPGLRRQLLCRFGKHTPVTHRNRISRWLACQDCHVALG